MGATKFTKSTKYFSTHKKLGEFEVLYVQGHNSVTWGHSVLAGWLALVPQFY